MNFSCPYWLIDNSTKTHLVEVIFYLFIFNFVFIYGFTIKVAQWNYAHMATYGSCQPQTKATWEEIRIQYPYCCSQKEKQLYKSFVGKNKNDHNHILKPIVALLHVLMPRAPGVPRSCQMDGYAISTHKGSWFSRYTCKKASGQGVRMHPPMVSLAMVREGDINQVAFY